MPGKFHRVLGDQRIFQAVVNDLKLTHIPEGKGYTYTGVDPYQLEDNSFPIVTQAIEMSNKAAFYAGQSRAGATLEEAHKNWQEWSR